MQALLAALALRCGQTVPVDRLIDNGWGDTPPAGSANALQRLVSDLRRLLGRGMVEWRGNGYAPCLDPSAVDLHRFEELSARAGLAIADADVARGRALPDEALALGREDPLYGLSDPEFARPQVTRINEVYAAALEARVEARGTPQRWGRLPRMFIRTSNDQTVPPACRTG